MSPRGQRESQDRQEDPLPWTPRREGQRALLDGCVGLYPWRVTLDLRKWGGTR